MKLLDTRGRNRIYDLDNGRRLERDNLIHEFELPADVKIFGTVSDGYGVVHPVWDEIPPDRTYLESIKMVSSVPTFNSFDCYLTSPLG